MADELSIDASLSYKDSQNVKVFMDRFTDKWGKVDVSDKHYVHHKQNIGTSEEALDLGGLATLGWAFFMNLDETNYVEIRSATGASNDIIWIPALTPAVFRFGSDISAPYAIANTAACDLEYLIFAR